jgi:glucosyl-3-phosphoglycerate phosphatase
MVLMVPDVGSAPTIFALQERCFELTKLIRPDRTNSKPPPRAQAAGTGETMPDLPVLYILRHGETLWNVAGRFQGHADSPLTLRGESQAISMGHALRDLGTDGFDWCASPAPRAVRTAELARGAPPCRTDPRLLEIAMGDWTGLTRTQIDARWPGPEGEDLMAFYARIPNGETLAAVATRASALLASLTRPTVLITHGITSRILRGLILGLPLDTLGQLPGGHGTVFRCSAGRVTIAAITDSLPPTGGTGISAV